MLKKQAKNKGSVGLGANQVYEIHFFVPGSGFKAGFYSAESKEMALQLFKQDHPAGKAFWIALARGKALAGPQQARYLVWWKSYGGLNWDPYMVFMLDSAGDLVGSIPDIGAEARKSAWELVNRRIAESNPKHRLQEMGEFDAGLLANEIQGARSMEQEQIFKDWESGKFDDLNPEGFPDMEWPESGAELEGLRDIPLPPNTPRPEIWNLEGVARAIRDGFTFGLPFKLGESLFSPNAYWIGGEQYSAFLLTVGPEHTPEFELLPDGWLKVKLFFQPEMVPERTWLGPPNSNGVVSVYAEIDPDTVDWDNLNRGHQFLSR